MDIPGAFPGEIPTPNESSQSSSQSKQLLTSTNSLQDTIAKASQTKNHGYEPQVSTAGVVDNMSLGTGQQGRDAGVTPVSTLIALGPGQQSQSVGITPVAVKVAVAPVTSTLPLRTAPESGTQPGIDWSQAASSAFTGVATAATAAALAARDAAVAAKDAAVPAAASARDTIAPYASSALDTASETVYNTTNAIRDNLPIAIGENLPKSVRNNLPISAQRALGTAHMEPVADEVPSQVRESFAHAHQAPEAAANPTAVHGKELFESELLASSSHSVAHQVPTTVRDSIAHSHRAPEAAADAGAVHKKAMVEGELLAHLEHSSPLGAGGIQSRREESSQAGLNSTANAAHSSGPAGMAELGFTSHNSVIGHGSHEDHDIALHQREGHSEDHRESQIDASSGKKERLHIAGAAAAVPIGAGVYNTVAGHGSQDDHHPTSVAPTARSIPADSNAVGAPGDLHPTNKSAVTFQDPTGTDSKTKNRLFPLVKKHPGSTAIVSDDNYFGPPSQAVSTGEAATPMPAELRPSRQREDTSIADESSGFETAGSAAVPGYSDDHAGDTSGPVTGANNTSSAPAKEPATVKTSGDSLNHLPSVTVSGVSHEANSTGRIFGFGMPRDQGSQITQTGLQEQHSQPAGTDRHTSGKQTAGQQALKNETLGQQSGPGRAAGNSAPGDGYNHLSSGTPSGVAS